MPDVHYGIFMLTYIRKLKPCVGKDDPVILEGKQIDLETMIFDF